MKLNKISRALVFLCGIFMFVSIFVPLWYIGLDAPQYPEGLGMDIYPNKLAGDVEIINDLNHYIGMKRLNADDFFEFTILPYLFAFVGILLLLVAYLNKRKYLIMVTIFYGIFGVVTVADFWRWEYNYGHDLDTTAAIIVPGMSYQPPLIGYKQLLNFVAFSLPHIGGVILIGVFLILLVCVYLNRKKAGLKSTFFPIISTLFLGIFLLSCQPKQEPIKLGTPCAHCKMPVADEKFASEIVNSKGKVFMFDDIRCTVDYLKEQNLESEDLFGVFVADFLHPKELLDVNNAVFLKSTDLRSPMQGNAAAFNNENDLQTVIEKYPGNIVQWKDLQ